MTVTMMMSIKSNTECPNYARLMPIPVMQYARVIPNMLMQIFAQKLFPCNHGHCVCFSCFCSLTTNQSTARPLPFAALAIDSAAQRGNFRDHNLPRHTGRVARQMTAAVGRLVAVVANIAAEETRETVKALVVAGAVVVAASDFDPVAIVVAGLVADMVDSAMRWLAVRAVTEALAVEVRDYKLVEMEAAVVAVMAEKHSFGYAEAVAANFVLCCYRRSSNSRSRHRTRWMEVLVVDRQKIVGGMGW